MMLQYAALIPRFYVLVDRSFNAMHLLPLFLKEDCSEFYECPSDCILRSLADSDAFQSGRCAEHNGRPETLAIIN